MHDSWGPSYRSSLVFASNTVASAESLGQGAALHRVPDRHFLPEILHGHPQGTVPRLENKGRGRQAGGARAGQQQGPAGAGAGEITPPLQLHRGHGRDPNPEGGGQTPNRLRGRCRIVC